DRDERNRSGSCDGKSGHANAKSGRAAQDGRHPSWTLGREAQNRPEQRWTPGKYRQRLLRRQLYPTAIDYYQRALKIEPANTGVRTDMATAIWYTGNADGAIAEFQKSLSYEPNKANTLFNLGVVEWQGKMDIDKAVAAWQKLLATNPNYEEKAKVE